MPTVTINGTTDNRPPDAADDEISVGEDMAPNLVIGNVLLNDVDPEVDSLVVSPAGTYPSPYGSLQLNADGAYQFELDNSNAEVDALDDG